MKKKLISILAMAIIASINLFAQNTVQLTNLKDKTVINYKLHHPAHEVEAKSNDMMVKIEYDKSSNQVTKAIAQVKVTSFDSGNSSRDSHAMEVIEATKFPVTIFKSTSIAYDGNNLKIYGELTFHGVTKKVTINGTQSIAGNTMVIKGTFGVSLDDHNVERPSLLFVPTDEYLHFDFQASFNIN